MFSRHNTTLFKSDNNIIISLLTVLWPLNTKSEMIMNTSKIHTLFQSLSMPFGGFFSGSFSIAFLPLWFILGNCVFLPILFILESRVFLPIPYRLESCNAVLWVPIYRVFSICFRYCGCLQQRVCNNWKKLHPDSDLTFMKHPDTELILMKLFYANVQGCLQNQRYVLKNGQF